MNDLYSKYLPDQKQHLHQAREIQIEIYRRMTPEQKLRICFDLNRSARELKAARLRKIHPDWSEQQVKDAVREIFLHART